MKVADLMPASSPADASLSSTFIPRRSAQRISMRSSISAQSWESVPPAPALTVTTASPPSYSPANRRASSSSARRSSIEARASSSSAAVDSSSGPPARGRGHPTPAAHLRERLEVVDVALERAEGLQAPGGARVLSGHGRRVLLVVPEARRRHLLLQIGDLLL